MKPTLQDRLDADVKDRLDPVVERYNSGGQVDAAEILPGNVLKALKRSNVFLPGANPQRIMTSIPFYGTVLVALCYECPPVRDVKLARPLIQSEPVVPVLINDYSKYPESFVREVVKFPHLSRREFEFYRHAAIIGQSPEVLCNHCADERLKKLLRDSPVDREVERLTKRFFSLLAPFVAPDFSLIDQFASAILRKDLSELNQLMELAWTIRTIRTAQAFGSAQSIPLDGIVNSPETRQVDSLFETANLEELKHLAAQELGLVIPTEIQVDRYLDIVLPLRPRLSALVDEVVKGEGKQSYRRVVEAVQEINEELRRTQDSKRFLAYRAIAGFAAGNSALIGGLLISGALGLGSHFAACGAFAVSAIGTKLIKKWKPVKNNRALKQLMRSFRASLQPAVAKVLSAYLGISTRAVEVWQLRQELIDQPVTVAGAAGTPSARKRKAKR